MSAILDNIRVVPCEKLAKYNNSRGIKMKPETFEGAKMFYWNNIGLENESVEAQQQVIENEVVDMQKQKPVVENGANLYDYKDIVLLKHDYSKEKMYTDSKPLKIQPQMYGKIHLVYDDFDNQQVVDNTQSVEIESKSLEQIQDEEIQKILNNVRKEVKPVFESKSIEQIQNEEISSLLRNIRINDIISNSKSLQRIEDEEIKNYVNNNEMPLRDVIQIVPDRSTDYQRVIDNEFENQEVTMISNEEVNQTVNADKYEEAPFKVSKYSQKEINLDKEDAIKKIQESISSALSNLYNVDTQVDNEEEVVVDEIPYVNAHVKSSLEFGNIKDKVSFNDVFIRPNKQNNIQFDFSKATNNDIEKVVETSNNKFILGELLKHVKEEQNKKSNLEMEIQNASQVKLDAEQRKFQATLELEHKRQKRNEVEMEVEQYIQQLASENEADMNKISNINRDSEDLYQQAEALIRQSEEEQNAIDEMYETIGQVRLRSAA